MRIRRFPLSLALGFLASCGGGGRTDAPRGEADRAERAGLPDSVMRASSGQELERGIAAQEGWGGPSSGSRDTLPAIGDSAVIAGIMRWDGTVAPFAAFDGAEWIRVARGAFERRSARAPVSRWSFFAVRGPKRVVGAGAMLESDECLMYESWRQATELDPGTLPWMELFDSEREREWAGAGCPMGRIGLALSAELPLVRMDDAAAGGPEASRLLERVRSVFEEQETGEIGHLKPDTADPTRYWTGHPVSPEERARVPIRLASLRRSEPVEGGVRLAYFVARRSYPPVARDGNECAVETSLEGFAIGDGLPVFVGPSVSLQGACSDSPGMLGLSVESYGLLRLDGRWFLLGLEEGYEWSAPVIYEITGAGPREVLRGWEP